MSRIDVVGVPGSAIVLFAHPDDPEFMAGGTIARWTDDGCRVNYVIMTDGRAGSAGLDEDDPMPEEELVARRQEEQRAAAALLGVDDIVFFDHHDTELFDSRDLRYRLAREIRKRKPEAAILFDPQRRVMPGYVQHPDHWTSGQAALAAVFPIAGTKRAMPELLAEGLEPHQVQDIYLAAPVDPNLRIDITDTIDRKIAAMLCHKTQIADSERLDELLRGMARAAAPDSSFEYSEAFHFIRIGARDRQLVRHNA